MATFGLAIAASCAASPVAFAGPPLDYGSQPPLPTKASPPQGEWPRRPYPRPLSDYQAYPPAFAPPYTDAEPRQAAPDYAESYREAAPFAPRRSEADYALPYRAGPRRAEPDYALPYQAGPRRAEPEYALPYQAGPRRAEPEYALPYRAGPRRAEPDLPLAPDFELNRHRGFGRLFPVLDPGAPGGRGLPAQASTLGALRALGEVLVESGDPDDLAGESDMPSGYTFLGLLVDHDLTLDLTTSLDSGVRGDEVRNARTPDLDLDNVYGAGPIGSPVLYRLPYLRTGRLIAGYGPYARHDVPRISGGDGAGPRGGAATAVLGDPRDDENLIVSQLHAAVVALHNRTVDVLVSRRFGRQRHRYCGSNVCSLQRLADRLPGPAKMELFEDARDHVLHFYHRVIADDLLPWLIGYRRTADLFARGRDFYFPRGFRGADGRMLDAYIPVEFAVAGFRYGHSQVRHSYILREGYRTTLFPGSGQGGIHAFSPVTPRELVDWRYFFEIDETPPPGFNWARRIDPLITPGLHRLGRARAVGAGELGSLPARNLQRGRVFYLPAGQDVAERMLPVLAARGVLGQGQGRDGWRRFVVPPSERVRYFLAPEVSPLWYYLLQEAEIFGISRGAYYTPAYARRPRDSYRRVAYGAGSERPREGGNSLGPVGGTIVGEVLVGLLEHFRERGGKGLAYRPEVQGSLSVRRDGPPRYLMRNFLLDAGVVGRE